MILITLLVQTGKATPRLIDEDLRPRIGSPTPLNRRRGTRAPADRQRSSSELLSKTNEGHPAVTEPRIHRNLFGRPSFVRHGGTHQINNVDMAQLKPDPVETHPPPSSLQKEPIASSDLSLATPTREAAASSVSPCEIWNSVRFHPGYRNQGFTARPHLDGEVFIYYTGLSGPVCDTAQHRSGSTFCICLLDIQKHLDDSYYLGQM
jgi:hypothetical protein